MNNYTDRLQRDIEHESPSSSPLTLQEGQAHDTFLKDISEQQMPGTADHSKDLFIQGMKHVISNPKIFHLCNKTKEEGIAGEDIRKELTEIITDVWATKGATEKNHPFDENAVERSEHKKVRRQYIPEVVNEIMQLFSTLPSTQPVSSKMEHTEASGIDKEEELVSVEVTGRYYPVQCQTCGWIGSSGYLDGGDQIADTGDYGDCYCPVCGQVDPDECEPKIAISSYKNAYQKMCEIIKGWRKAYDDQHWKHLGEEIERKEKDNTVTTQNTGSINCQNALSDTVTEGKECSCFSEKYPNPYCHEHGVVQPSTIPVVDSTDVLKKWLSTKHPAIAATKKHVGYSQDDVNEIIGIAIQNQKSNAVVDYEKERN